MSLQDDLENAVTQVQQDSQTLHEIVHGDSDTTVMTEGGEVPSPAKVIRDVENTTQASIDELSQSLAELQTSIEQTREQIVSTKTHAQRVTEQARALNLPESLAGHRGAVLTVANDESSYTLTQSQGTVYGLCKVGSKLLVHVGGDYHDVAAKFATYLLAPTGITFDIDQRGHLLMHV